MNTNADALSRIELNSDILKTMIPICDEETASKKLLPITRSMKIKDNINGQDDNSQKSHDLRIWECTSITDINNARKLTFSHSLEIGRINKMNNDFIIGFNDNPTYLDMIMEKLITFMHKNYIRDLALSKYDNIFKVVSVEKFKESYTNKYKKLLKRLRNLYMNIILYNPLKRINDQNMQMKIIKEIMIVK